MNFFVCFLFVTTMPFFCYIPYYMYRFFCIRDCCNKEQLAYACIYIHDVLNTFELVAFFLVILLYKNVKSISMIFVSHTFF